MALEKGEAWFHYLIEFPEKRIEFTEKLFFPPLQANGVPPELLKTVLESLLLILGISYWKLYCPRQLNLGSIFLTKEQAQFWTTVYTKGLGEFFYVNKIDYRGLIEFPFSEHTEASLVVFPRQHRALLPLGGGKDSIVSAELLKKNNTPFDVALFAKSNGSFPIHEGVLEAMEKQPLIIRRELDPKLFVLNNQEGVYNGHVPVSAMYAFLGLFAAVLYDYRFIVLSNEKSASYGNTEYLGEEVNHQWSKSEEFEKMFQKYVADNITHDVEYFSLLRPLSEIKIAQIFSNYSQYFSLFSSCNRNFTIKSSSMQGKWCGQCPKCAFVFAMLSAFLFKKEVVKIFGKNLFADQALISVYKELLGMEKFKPFECVGTPEEVRLAFILAHKKGEYNDDVVIKMFEEALGSEFSSIETKKAALLPDIYEIRRI